MIHERISMPATLRRSVLALLRPTLAAHYRRTGGDCPDWVLAVLGIATLTTRPGFETLARILDSVSRFDGAIIECGVFRGATLLGMAHRLRHRNLAGIRIIGCDSFEGLPEPVTQDAQPDGTFHEVAQRGRFSETSRAALQQRIDALGFPTPIMLMEGFFDRTLSRLVDERFSVAHLDCDLYESYRTCLRHLYPRMVPGGYIVFDEYDYSASAYPGAQRAIDEFFADKPERIEKFSDLPIPRYFVRKVDVRRA
jgi:O-methyltransferase